ncbi:MAG: hypothetical protein IT452_04150 [Planctomycetia bacterium]|nr:hypothetical protein [Planctomycetia bacterium]
MPLRLVGLVFSVCITITLLADPGDTPRPLDGGDRSEELRDHLIKGFELKRSGQTERWQAFLRTFVMPKPAEWFQHVFGEETGRRLSTAFARKVDGIAEAVDRRCQVPPKGELSIRITRIQVDNQEGNRFERSIVTAMCSKESLYRAEGWSESEGSWLFLDGIVYANGGFRLPDVLREAMAPVDRCAERLAQIEVYLALFESKFARYPIDFSEIQRPDMLTEERVLRCTAQDDAADGFQYFYPFLESSTPPTAIVAWDKTPHPGNVRNVLTFAGKVDLMAEEDFEKALALQRKSSVEGLKKELAKNQEWSVSVREKSPPRELRRSVLVSLLRSCEGEADK